ncbi:hypothetical protein [Vibrio phage RYC]|nr:hypothetical protein [Vibrio phage RYC]
MDNYQIEELVTTFRKNGAIVSYDEKNPTDASVDVTKGYSSGRLFIGIADVQTAIRDLAIRSTLDSINSSDKLLITILENSCVIRKD